ncbi:MAG: hypothetical protein U9Q40_06785 [Campylobacterota bacterium]|nr:hypothetical protein [Campylobacterota bacterium]
MIEYAGLIAYLYFISENIGFLVEMFLAVGIVVLTTSYLVGVAATVNPLWTRGVDIHESYSDDYKHELEVINKIGSYFKLTLKVWLVTLILYSLTPTRNQLIVIFSAQPVVEQSLTITNSIMDSNRTKSIGNILDNSIKYLENQSEQLNKE